jgi:hypothetical protein
MRYSLFFVAEIAGMVLILWIGVPIFRELIRLRQSATFNDEIVLLIAVILIQSSYWKCLRQDPPFEIARRPFEGHVVLFVSRLGFIFASSVFSFVVYRYSDMFELPFVRSCVMMAVLFSVFCFTRHLEKLGGLMLTGFHLKSVGR